jgi:HTH-type transcriptional regulator/antitoxin HigA
VEEVDMTNSLEKKKRAPGRAADDYLALVKRFPLRPLRSRKELREAGEILDHYIGREGLTAGERDYLAALSMFVERYERDQGSAQLKVLTPLEILKHLMEENSMSTTDLGTVLGSRGLASEVLNGNRGLSKTLIRKLAEKFGVDPGLFLEASKAA